jgi:hypothetical protein
MWVSFYEFVSIWNTVLLYIMYQILGESNYMHTELYNGRNIVSVLGLVNGCFLVSSTICMVSKSVEKEWHNLRRTQNKSVNEESDTKPETGYRFSDSSYRAYCQFAGPTEKSSRFLRCFREENHETCKSTLNYASCWVKFVSGNSFVFTKSLSVSKN